MSRGPRFILTPSLMLEDGGWGALGVHKGVGCQGGAAGAGRESELEGEKKIPERENRACTGLQGHRGNTRNSNMTELEQRCGAQQWSLRSGVTFRGALHRPQVVNRVQPWQGGAR